MAGRSSAAASAMRSRLPKRSGQSSRPDIPTVFLPTDICEEGFLDMILAFIMLFVLAGGIVTMIDGGWGDGSD